MAYPSNQAPGQSGSHGPQAYLKTKVLTASPAELRLMLLDGAIRFSEQTRRGYESKDFESAFDGTTKAQAILLEAESLCGASDPRLDGIACPL